MTHSGAAQQAVCLGSAIRLTSILRDLRRDWERGRLYLPLEDLVRFGYGERHLARGAVNDSFLSLMKFEVARARGLYRAGAEGICWLADEGSRLMVSTLALTGAGTLDGGQCREADRSRA